MSVKEHKLGQLRVTIDTEDGDVTINDKATEEANTLTFDQYFKIGTLIVSDLAAALKETPMEG